MQPHDNNSPASEGTLPGAGFVHRLGARVLYASDEALAARLPAQLVTLIYALLTRYGQQAYRQRCRRLALAKPAPGPRDFIDAFAFLSDASSLQEFLNAKEPKKRKLIGEFFSLATYLHDELLRKEANPQEARPTNFDFQQLHGIKLWVREELQHEEFHWHNTLLASYHHNHQQWQADFRQQVLTGVVDGTLSSLAEVEKRWGSLGVRRLRDLMVAGEVSVCESTGLLLLPAPQPKDL